MKGVVDSISSTSVAVTYETPDGPFQAHYDPAQFVKSRMPQEGDNVEAIIRLYATRPPKPVKEFKPNLPRMGHLATKGPIKL
jgi:hypothetical protein